MESITNYSNKTIHYKFIYMDSCNDSFFSPGTHFTPTLADVVYLGPYATFTTLDMLYIFDADEFRAATAKPKLEEETIYWIQYKEQGWVTDTSFLNENDARNYIQAQVNKELTKAVEHRCRWSILKRTEERILA